jgi:hypothetical protein
MRNDSAGDDKVTIYRESTSTKNGWLEIQCIFVNVSNLV